MAPQPKTDELGDWKRTCYSLDVTPEREGERVTVFGWVASIRRQKGVTFLLVNDRDGVVQVTVHNDRAPKSVLSRLKGLRVHSSVAVRGVVQGIGKAPHGAEILPEEVRILAVPKRLLPFQLYAKKGARIDTRLEARPLDLRRPLVQAIFRIRRRVLEATREFFAEAGYMDVNTPKIIASATEGGASLFPVLYYDKEAFLTQSPQLYKEQLVLAFERVFEVGPAFRAEQSRTLSHLSEFTSVDVEEAFANYHDAMDRVENLTHHIYDTISRDCRGEAEILGVEFKPPSRPFPRYTYDDAVSMLREEGERVEWGSDFSSGHLDALGARIPGFYFIIDWPTASKPFYISPKGDKPELCEAFDFMHGPLEIASGGTRVSSKPLLVKRLRQQGLSPKSFEFHLRAFDYGMPPHAGFGLGLERLLMVITKVSNIREVTFYPRDQYHLTP